MYLSGVDGISPFRNEALGVFLVGKVVATVCISNIRIVQSVPNEEPKKKNVGQLMPPCRWFCEGVSCRLLVVVVLFP